MRGAPTEMQISGGRPLPADHPSSIAPGFTRLQARLVDGSERHRMTCLHYRCITAIGTWTDGANFGLDHRIPAVLVTRALGRKYGAGQCGSLGTR